MSIWLCFAVMTVLTLILSAAFTRLIIPKLKSLKLGQKILDVGPRWHKSKEGTPTMGGLAFILAFVISMTVMIVYYAAASDGSPRGLSPLLMTVALGLSNGAVGIVDDLAKFRKQENEGLTARQKYLLQLLIAGLYLFGMKMLGFITTKMYIPFAGVELELGIFYYVISLILITGIVNSVNLTDGIDGLASSVTFVVAVFMTVAGMRHGSIPEVLISGGLIGCTLGFLTYNFYPARIFMGDTGSLFLGGMIAGFAFMSGNPLLVLIYGFVYVFESISVILQVASFKLTGKRIFKMSPIHHHFEKCGWSEKKIVYVFSAATLLLCVLSWFGL